MQGGNVYSLATAKSLTNGGRALNAIWQNTKLTTQERIVLLYLGSQLDFTGDFTESRWVPVSRLCAATGISRASMFRVLGSLQENGYILKENRFGEIGQLANAYSITDKIFAEYAQLLEATPPSQAETPPVSERDSPPSQAETPPVSERDSPRLTVRHETPSVAPSVNPSNNFSPRTKLMLKKEARQIGRHLFMPVATQGEYGQQRQRFVDQQAVDRCMEKCLEDYGIDVLKRLEQMYVDKAGELPFKPQLIRAACKEIAEGHPH